jgi:hypothetical protein
MSDGSIIRALRALRLIGATELPVAVEVPPPGPRAYLGPYPILTHRTLAEVDSQPRRLA